MAEITLDDRSKEVLGHLLADVLSASSLMVQHDYHQFLRRTYIRTFFAYVEGFGVVTREALLQTPEATLLASEKQCILRDQKYEVQKNGKPDCREARHPFLNLLAATLRYWAELRGWDEEKITKSIFGVDGWNLFQRTLDIRNRLTHPKPGENMEISVDELKDATNAFKWFAMSTAELLNVTIDRAAIERAAKAQAAR
jgi:hypothetical protein